MSEKAKAALKVASNPIKFLKSLNPMEIMKSKFMKAWGGALHSSLIANFAAGCMHGVAADIC